MNAIEGVWADLRKVIRKDRIDNSLASTAKAWYSEWDNYPQEEIQKLIRHQLEKENPNLLHHGGDNHFHG